MTVLAALVGCTAPTPSFQLRSGAVHPSPLDGGPGLAVFSRGLRASDRDALAAAGLEPIAPLGRAWLVRGTPRRAVPGVAWTAAIPAERKVDPALRQPGDAIVWADLAPGADVERLVARLHDQGLPVDGVAPRRLATAVPAERVDDVIAALADDPDVLWLGRRGRRVLLDAVQSTIGQTGPAGGGATPFLDVGLDGTGQIAAYLDSGIDVDHCLFSDAVFPATNTTGTDVELDARKVIAVDFLWSGDDPADPLAWDDDSHGSHVAGVIAGDLDADGELDPADGLALGAKLVVQDAGSGADNCANLPGLGCPVVDLQPIFEQAYAQGARVHSDSWGDRENAPVTNTYSDGSADADAVAWDHPDYLLVFASGNGGAENQVWSPGNAKNTLSVGATLTGASSSTMSTFSSGGPTFDGRIKPDLVFPGQAESALTDGDIGTNNCNALASSGTSVSTPGVAGLALVVRQYYADGWYPSGAPSPSDSLSPSAALVKATLIASAEPVLESTLSFTGWGRPQLDRVLPIATATAPTRGLLVYDESDDRSFAGGEPPWQTAISIDSGTESLRVALVWRDPPGTPMADSILVNDLDLTVTGNGGLWHGNVIGDFWSRLNGGADHANNVEIVRFEHPVPGDYTISVAPTSIGAGPQPFALVIAGDFDEIPVPGHSGDTGGGTTEPPPTGETGEDTDTVVPPPSDTAKAADEECNCATASEPAGLAPLALAALALVRARRSRGPRR